MDHLAECEKEYKDRCSVKLRLFRMIYTVINEVVAMLTGCYVNKQDDKA